MCVEVCVLVCWVPDTYPSIQLQVPGRLLGDGHSSSSRVHQRHGPKHCGCGVREVGGCGCGVEEEAVVRE